MINYALNYMKYFPQSWDDSTRLHFMLLLDKKLTINFDLVKTEKDWLVKKMLIYYLCHDLSDYATCLQMTESTIAEAYLEQRPAHDLCCLFYYQGKATMHMGKVDISIHAWRLAIIYYFSVSENEQQATPFLYSLFSLAFEVYKTKISQEHVSFWSSISNEDRDAEKACHAIVGELHQMVQDNIISDVLMGKHLAKIILAICQADYYADDILLILIIIKSEHLQPWLITWLESNNGYDTLRRQLPPAKDIQQILRGQENREYCTFYQMLNLHSTPIPDGINLDSYETTR